LKDLDFCNRLLDTEKVAAVPGSAFGAEGYLRLSYATSDEIDPKRRHPTRSFLRDVETLNYSFA
jgi:aspartate/methionine/tyrosine aminotransferase